MDVFHLQKHSTITIPQVPVKNQQVIEKHPYVPFLLNLNELFPFRIAKYLALIIENVEYLLEYIKVEE